jgi:hypothetical protein
MRTDQSFVAKLTRGKLACISLYRRQLLRSRSRCLCVAYQLSFIRQRRACRSFGSFTSAPTAACDSPSLCRVSAPRCREDTLTDFRAAALSDEESGASSGEEQVPAQDPTKGAPVMEVDEDEEEQEEGSEGAEDECVHKGLSLRCISLIVR